MWQRLEATSSAADIQCVKSAFYTYTIFLKFYINMVSFWLEGAADCSPCPANNAPGPAAVRGQLLQQNCK